MTVDPRRWERIQALFHEALELPAAERNAFLQAAAGGDADLAAQVMALVEEDARTGLLLDRGVAPVAQHVLDSVLPPAQRIGPYRVVRVAGRGGMAVVYLAERDDLGSRAAIKVLHDATLSPLRRERFAAEQRTLAQLEHPHIATLHDADVLPDGTPYFVMEYVDGVSITEHARTAHLDVRQRLSLFRSVCEAVQYAHSRAILHLDIKPANIMVRTDGTVKLLDFGIARQVESAASRTDPTRTALRLMTPAYAAPEQVLGQPLGTHTDVYSLGATLYELLAGRPPFEMAQITPGQLEKLVLDGEPERPSLASRAAGGGDGTPGRAAWADLDVLCLTAMHRDVRRRYSTVDALIRDVDHYLAGRPLDARPDGLGYRADRFVRRNWRGLAGAAAVAALVLALAATYTVRLAAARDAAVAEAARTQQIQRFVLDLFQGGDAEAGPADTLRVLTLLARGVEEARVLDGAPDLQAELYATLGGIYHSLGQLTRADSLLQLALEQRRELRGPDHPDVAASLVALGSLRTEQADLDEAESLIRAGLSISRQQLPREHPAIAAALTALGVALQNRGAYDDAIAVLEEAVTLQRDGGSSAAMGRSLGELANTHFYAGNLPASDSLNRELLQLSTQRYGERHPSVADDLINLGAVQFEMGRYEDAERLYRDGLEIKLAFFGPDHPQTAAAMTMVGRALVPQGRHAEATAMLQPALSVRERVYGPVHPRVASTLNELGTIALATGDLAAAEQHFRRMARIYDTVYPDGHYLQGIALSNLANVFFDAGDFAQAERTMTRTVDVFTATLSATHTNTAIARIKLGRALAGQRRFGEAEQQLRAGYDILLPQVDPGSRWLQTARSELEAAYRALGRSADAARMRDEHLRHASNAGS